MRYFANIRTEAEAKARYRELAKKLHPDAGGKATEFQAMKKEFDKFCISFQHQERVNPRSTSNTKKQRKSNPPKSAPKTTQKRTRQQEYPLPREPYIPSYPTYAPQSSPLEELTNFVKVVNRAAPAIVSAIEGIEKVFSMFNSEE